VWYVRSGEKREAERDRDEFAWEHYAARASSCLKLQWANLERCRWYESINMGKNSRGSEGQTVDRDAGERGG
jgi:hypothetical protein